MYLWILNVNGVWIIGRMYHWVTSTLMLMKIKIFTKKINRYIFRIEFQLKVILWLWTYKKNISYPTYIIRCIMCLWILIIMRIFRIKFQLEIILWACVYINNLIPIDENMSHVSLTRGLMFELYPKHIWGYQIYLISTYGEHVRVFPSVIEASHRVT